MKVERKQISIHMNERTIEKMNKLKDILDFETNSRLIEELIEEKTEVVNEYLELFAKHKFVDTNQVLTKGEFANECAHHQEPDVNASVTPISLKKAR